MSETVEPDRTEAEDRRVQKTRQALIQAFLDLVVERPYDEIKVGDVSELADVGRSTFYQHFENKDDLLRKSLDRAFMQLANILSDDCDPRALEGWAGLFWDSRRTGRVLLSGQTRPFVARALAEMIEPRLAGFGPAPLTSTKLIAFQLAEAQLALIHAWLTARAAATPAAIAATLIATTRAAARAACGGVVS